MKRKAYLGPKRRHASFWVPNFLRVVLRRLLAGLQLLVLAVLVRCVVLSFVWSCRRHLIQVRQSRLRIPSAGLPICASRSAVHADRICPAQCPSIPFLPPPSSTLLPPPLACNAGWCCCPLPDTAREYSHALMESGLARGRGLVCWCCCAGLQHGVARTIASFSTPHPIGPTPPPLVGSRAHMTPATPRCRRKRRATPRRVRVSIVFFSFRQVCFFLSCSYVSSSNCFP